MLRKRKPSMRKARKTFSSSLAAGENHVLDPNIFGLDKLEIPLMNDTNFVGGVLSISSCAALLVNGYNFQG